MRFVTFRLDGATRAGVVDGDSVIELPYGDVGELLRSGDDWQQRARAAEGPRHQTAELSLAPLVVAPEKIICLGRNYLAHIEELDRDIPEFPILFAKYARSLVGADDPIELPPSDMVDWEAELVIIVGREVRHARGDAALQAIAGYTIMNDVSVRDWQFRTPQWLQGKTFERSTPLGPELVTVDEVPDLSQLTISCEVDGEVRQKASCGDLIFKPQQIIEYISDIITLAPGDVIATGTPGGVGHGMKPPTYLSAGSVVRTSVTGMGACTNVCRDEGWIP